IVFANPPVPVLTKEGQRWAYERYSYRGDHITDDWLDELMRIAAQPKFQASVRKMDDEGLYVSQFVPELARQKEELHEWIRQGRLTAPTLIVWGADDRTSTLSQAMPLYELIAPHVRRAQLHIFDRAGHFVFREHPAEFNDVLRTFIQYTEA